MISYTEDNQVIKEEYKTGSRFFQNINCEFFPCHHSKTETDDRDNFSCLFCFCPLYSLNENCGGNYTYAENGVKDCSKCDFPHKKENYETMMEKIKKLYGMK